MISANGGWPAHRYTPQVTQRWPRGSEPASLHWCSVTGLSTMAGTNDLSAEELSRLRSLLRQTQTGTAHVCTVNAFFFGFGDFEFWCCNFYLRVIRICNL